jgi:hypothetical protein
MCEIWELRCQSTQTATDVAAAVTETMVGDLADMVADAQSALIIQMVTWWLDAGPVEVTGGPAARVQEWMLPFAALVAVGGMMWQALLMIINRKGEPLLAVGKGLFATTVWGAVSLAGTQAVLRGCEAYSQWILTQGLDCQPGVGQDTACKTDALAARMQILLAPTGPGTGTVLVLLLGLFTLAAGVAQALLLLFRDGATIILAGMLQLAAAGTFTSATSNWLRRTLGWLLALVFYEPFAATCYAVGFMFVGDRRNDDVRTWLTGVATIGLSLVALPAMMRFFNWTVGAVQQAGNSGGMLAAAGAAGLHAVASHRAGGFSAVDYARDVDRRYPTVHPAGTAAPAGPRPPTFTGPPAAAGATSAAGAAAPVAATVVAAGHTTAGTARAAATAGTRGMEGR